MTSPTISTATKTTSPAATRLILIADLKQEIKELEVEMKREVELLEKEIPLSMTASNAHLSKLNCGNMGMKQKP
jgi:hypothetical protein